GGPPACTSGAQGGPPTFFTCSRGAPVLFGVPRLPFPLACKEGSCRVHRSAPATGETQRGPAAQSAPLPQAGSSPWCPSVPSGNTFMGPVRLK
ncbi:unnamed protein product, partial [Amoebophrya sp. A120]